jgi:hypothetical protein
MKKVLNDEMKSVSSEYLDGIREDIDLYADIRKYLPRLTDILRDMNTLTVEIHSKTGFEELIKAVEAKMEE